MLRMSLARAPVGDLPLRQGRAIAWIGEALEPLRPTLGGTTVDQLSVVIRSATGIEALVWLTDVAGLHRDDASNLMHWAGMALLHGAELGQPPPERRKRGRRRRAV